MKKAKNKGDYSRNCSVRLTPEPSLSPSPTMTSQTTKENGVGGEERRFLSTEPAYKALKDVWQDWGHKLNLTHLFNTDPCRFQDFR